MMHRRQRVAMINVVLIGLGSLIGTCRAQTGVAGVAETKGQELMQHLQTLQGRAQAAEVRAIDAPAQGRQSAHVCRCVCGCRCIDQSALAERAPAPRRAACRRRRPSCRCCGTRTRCAEPAPLSPCPGWMVSAAAFLRAHLTRRRVQALRSGGGGGGYSSYPPPPPGEPGECGAHLPRRPRALSRACAHAQARRAAWSSSSCSS